MDSQEKKELFIDKKWITLHWVLIALMFLTLCAALYYQNTVLYLIFVLIFLGNLFLMRVRICCPECRSAQPFGVIVRAGKGFFYCFNCGAHITIGKPDVKDSSSDGSSDSHPE